MGMVTLRDVAREAGLSVYTVSDILNCNDRRYRETTRRRVLRIGERLGYRPHRQAQMMRTGQSRTIGLILYTTLLQTAYERAYHVSRFIRANGYDVIVHDTVLAAGSGASAVAAMIADRVAGVILTSCTDDFGVKEIEALRREGIPLVTLRTRHHPGIPLVSFDDRRGLRDLTCHMVGRGYRHLAYLTQPSGPSDWFASERMDGFRDAIEAAGGKIVTPDRSRNPMRTAAGRKAGHPASVIGEVVIHQGDGSSLNPFLSGHQAMGELLRRPSRPQAVLCQNDDWAVGAIAACAEAGVRVPQDLAITGFDNTFVGDTITPRLTTMVQPIEAMAQKTVDLLFNLIRGVGVAPGEEVFKLPCQLVIRQSCGNPTAPERIRDFTTAHSPAQVASTTRNDYGVPALPSTGERS